MPFHKTPQLQFNEGLDYRIQFNEGLDYRIVAAERVEDTTEFQKISLWIYLVVLNRCQ